MIEILSGILTGLGFGNDPSGRHNDRCFMAGFNVQSFRPLEEFKKEVTEFVRYLKDTPLTSKRPMLDISAREFTFIEKRYVFNDISLGKGLV